MSVKQSDYEALLAEYCSQKGAISLLRQYRAYLEKLPSLRRPEQSLITIPLPIVRILYPKTEENSFGHSASRSEAIALPCDLALLMCDPEWQIKLGAEILVFIYRPDENFSDLLIRWRKSQIYLDKDYEWLMPTEHQHMFSEGAEEVCPLFILFAQTPSYIKKGLEGASLPYLVQPSPTEIQEPISELILGDELGLDSILDTFRSEDTDIFE
ncbi:MAG: hypothetical protein ACRC6M_01045 [Microcystaceae cyanobacterium]